MTSRNLKAEFNLLVRTVIVPLMKAHGFERRGQSFRRLHGEVFQYFSLDGNRYNDAEHFSFTGNFSFLRNIPSAAEDFWCDDAQAWLAGFRLGQLTHGRDHWYRMEDASFDDLSKQVEAVLKDQLLPLLAQLQDPAAVQAYQAGHSSGG